MSYLHPPKSPCHECGDIGLDKNRIKCQTCKDRLEYLKAVDPECLSVFARYSNSGGKTRYVNREGSPQKKLDEAAREIRRYAASLCSKGFYPFYMLTNTGIITRPVVRERRALIRHLKQKFAVSNITIAAALRIHPTTIGAVLRRGDNG